MILLNNVTYFIHFILAHYIDVQCSAVKCSALHCSVIHYSEFLFSSGKCSALHLRAIYYNTRTHLHQSALGSSLSFAIKYTFSNMQEHSTKLKIFMNLISNFFTVQEEKCSHNKYNFCRPSTKYFYILNRPGVAWAVLQTPPSFTD